MTVSTDREEITRSYEELATEFRVRAFVERDLTAIDEYLVDDFVDHFAPQWDLPGKEGVRQRFGQAAGGFHTLKVEIVHSMSKGNVLMQAIRIHMKHTGHFMGRPATGREFWIGGFDAFEIRDGKLAAHWGVYDVARIPDLLGLAARAEEPEAANSWASMWSSAGS
jgi:predicted SnoaL-like aldol condensation-catalyzing enzyme